MKSYIHTALLGAAGLLALTLTANAAGSTTATGKSLLDSTTAPLIKVAQRNENPGGGGLRNENPGGGGVRNENPGGGGVRNENPGGGGVRNENPGGGGYKKKMMKHNKHHRKHKKHRM